MGVEVAQCVCIVSGGNYLVPGTFRTALAIGAKVSESPPEEMLATVHTDLRLFS